MVEAEDVGRRLDKLLVNRDAAYSRATYQRWIREGRVTLDGEPAESNTRPRVGQEVAVRPAPPPASTALPQALPLEVVYEDAHLIVVNKVAGMVVHPAPGHPDGTLVNAALHHFGSLPGEDLARPGVVHRIDAWTSGLMVVARSVRAREGLMERFRAHDIDRAYLAVARGRLFARTYDTLHGRHPGDRKRFSSKVTRGRRAVTHVAPVERLHGATLLRCRLETGRTHQIRVHLADDDHGLIGDPLYGRIPRDPRLRAAALALGRQALHAGRLGFSHPVNGAPLSFEIDPPPDFQELLTALRAGAGDPTGKSRDLAWS